MTVYREIFAVHLERTHRIDRETILSSMRILFGVLAAFWLSSCQVGACETKTNPFAEADKLSEDSFLGEVEEILPAGPYSYLKILGDGGKSYWVAILNLGQTPRQRVSVRLMARSDSLYSRRLSRRFTPLHYGIVRALEKQ